MKQFPLQFSRSQPVAQGKAGFTLIEILVAIAIMGLLTAVVVFKQGDLSDSISVDNVANDINLQIRQAQVYGISVRETAVGSNVFTTAYGVDFNKTTSGSFIGSGASFYTFADGGGSPAGSQNGYFDTWGTCVVGTNECAGWNQLLRGNTISSLCVILSNGTTYTPVKRIAVTFLRPNPKARIVFFDTNKINVTSSFAGFLGAKIVISSPKGKTKTISVFNTGQVAIQ